ncbi:hypothetical protein EC968_001547 [Mortierella alpina]|nr:hypothetical protein EC968_001547 [Mortierella alpina]
MANTEQDRSAIHKGGAHSSQETDPDEVYGGEERPQAEMFLRRRAEGDGEDESQTRHARPMRFSANQSELASIARSTNNVDILHAQLACLCQEGHRQQQRQQSPQQQLPSPHMTEYRDKNTAIMEHQITVLAQALLSVLDVGVKDDQEKERIRRLALDVLKSYPPSAPPSPSDHWDPYVRHGLLTPEATPVSTPVMSATMQRPTGTPESTSTSRIEGHAHHLSESPEALTLPCSMLSSDTDMCVNDRGHDSDHPRSSGEGSTLQDSVSHFSDYRIHFPVQEGPSLPTTGGDHVPKVTVRARRLSKMTMPNLSPFLSVFGKAHSGAVEQAKGRVVEDPSSAIATGATEDTPSAVKRNTWFLRHRRGSKTDSSTSSASTFEATSASVLTSPAAAPASSSTTTATTTTVMETRQPSRRRFSTPLNFQRRRAASIVQPARMATLQTTMTAVTEGTKATTAATTTAAAIVAGRSFSCSGVETTTSPTAEGSQNGLSSFARSQHNGYHPTALNTRLISQTATGSYFDSVSDDESDTEEEVLQRTVQRTAQRPTAQSAPLPYPRHSRPVQSQYYNYGNVDNTDTDADEESERDETDDDDDDDEDEDEEDDEDEDQSENSNEDEGQQEDHEPQELDLICARRSWRSVNPQTLEGYEHQFDDAPPPSYHSLTRSDPHALSSGPSPGTLSPPSSSSSLPPPMMAGSTLSRLLELLHEFEEHLRDSFRTASFRRSSSPCTDALTTVNGAAAIHHGLSRRQSWLARHPQTVVSFAYLLIELEQTGILSDAMSASWTGLGISASTQASSSTSGNVAPAERPSSTLTLTLTSTETETPNGSALLATTTTTTEQAWLAMAGNATTEMQLAKAMLVLEQNCVHGMDPVRWHGHARTGDPTGRTTTIHRRDRWMAKVQSISAFA